MRNALENLCFDAKSLPTRSIKEYPFTRGTEREGDTIFKKSIHIFNISISFLPETIIITMITIMSSKRENSDSKVSRFKTWIFFFFNHESISRVFFSSRRKNVTGRQEDH